MATYSPGIHDHRKRVVPPPKVLLLILPAVILLCAFLVVPMLGLLRSSFYPGSSPFVQSGVSVEQYVRLISDTFYLNVLVDTIVIALIVALVSLIIGFPVGYSLARLPPHQRRWRMILVVLPLTLSLVVVVFGWLVILGRQGLVNSVLLGLGLVDSPQRFLFNRTAVLIVLIHQFLPFMILSIMSVVTQIAPELERASANLRANRLKTFRRIIIPLAMPGILTGFSLVFVLAVSAFITPRIIGGARIQMYGNLIYEQILVTLNWPFGSAMSFILIATTLIVMMSFNALIAGTLFRKGRNHAR